MACLLDNMTQEQKIKFQFADLMSRNLIDEETAEKELEKKLKELREKEEVEKGVGGR